MKKTILILSQEQPPTVGGAGMIAKQLFDTLTARGWSTTINKSYGSYSRLVVLFLSFVNVIRAVKYHRVIINDLFYKKIFCLCLKFYNSNNTLIYLHGSEPEFLLSSSFYKERFIKLCLKSQRVIAVSNYMKEKFLADLCDHPDYLKIESKIVVIKNGVDTTVFQNVSALPRDIINIATCCRLDWGKGFKDMTSVIMELQDQNINYHWYIAGEGKDSKSIKAYILERKISANVTFLGPQPPAGIAALFNICHFMLLLSNFKESLGLAYMEASCCGCFSIGRNSYGVKEAIVDGKTGALINSVDAVVDTICSLKTNSENISAIALKHYAIETMYEKLESFLN